MLSLSWTMMGLCPISSVIINTIGLWAQFYDLPIALRRIYYVQKLGTCPGQVQRVDMSYPNYARVRVLFSRQCFGPRSESSYSQKG
jgi:hypothetical protein